MIGGLPAPDMSSAGRTLDNPAAGGRRLLPGLRLVPDWPLVCGRLVWENTAGSHARRLLVFSHPPRNRLSRAAMGWENLVRRLRHNDFRTFVHPPGAMQEVVEANGLTLTYRHKSMSWTVLGFERALHNPSAETS